MQIEIPDIDIQAIINDELNKSLSEDALRAIIQKSAGACVKEAIEKQFGWNGSLKEGVEAFVKEKITFDPSKIHVSTYSDIVCEQIRLAIEGFKDSELERKAQLMVEEIMEGAPKKYKLSDILQLYREHHSLDDDELVEYEEISEYSSISFDDHIFKSSGCDKLKLHIFKRKDTNSITYIYHGKKMVGERIDLANWHNLSALDKTLYRLEKAETEIEFDIDEGDHYGEDYDY